MAKKKDVKPSDDDSFASLMGDVKRIVSDRAPDDTPRPPPVPSQRLKDERLALEESRLPNDPIYEELSAGEALNWCRDGFNHDLKRLKRGDFTIEGELDLHGMTSPEAKTAADRCRCVRVIHGKGRGSPGRVPVLKGKTARWLKDRDEVLGWVLLKKR